MSTILNTIKSYFIKNEFRTYSQDIKKSLSALRFSLHNLQAESEEMRKQRTPITDDQIHTIKTKYETLLQNQKPFYAVNQPTSSFVRKHTKILDSVDLFKSLEHEHSTIMAAIHEQLHLLSTIKDEVNSKIARYSGFIHKFVPAFENLKGDYIPFTTHKTLEHDAIVSSYQFFKEGQGNINDAVIQKFVTYFDDLPAQIKQWNQEYVEREMELNKALFDDIDGKALDQQQRRAIVTDEESNLVLAGAGSGKTLTISGKVKYLVERKNVKPEEILLISFTKKASEEMNDRIANKLGVKVDVKTFHKFGLEIISHSRTAKPDVFSGLDKVIDEYFKNQLFMTKNYLQMLLHFFGFYLNIPKDFSDFDSVGDYHEHYKTVDFETLKGKAYKQKEYVQKHTQELAKTHSTYQGEQVKSLEEFMIANFLFLNGIEYCYEQPYPYDTADENYRQYKPDFYLPDYELYIEHFGVNEHFQTPHLSKMEQQIYLEGMEWKRQLHKENKTKLIESYSFYNKDGILLEKLEENLKKHHVEFREVDFKELFNNIYDQTNDRYFSEFKKLIGTFINLFKSNGYDSSKFETFHTENNSKLRHFFYKKRNQIFFYLVEPIYRYYQDQLLQLKEIDFNDMINLATNLVKQGKVTFQYKYIIIDEYQDISHSRFNLINAIREQTKAKIMCVGDDWQSIYRFSGSDVQLFTKFGNYFGQHELVRIEKTYRNSQQLIDIAGQFVMKNPSQYKKELTSDKDNPYPLRILGFKGNQILVPLLSAIDEIVSLYGDETDILLLGRNNFDIKILDGVSLFKVSRDGTRIIFQKYPRLEITFLTIHRSKGLEANNVILLNAKNSTVGFPNKISDDPILSWVLTDKEEFWFAEERRLFYVAVTRTKNTTYILTPEGQESTFIKELRSDYDIYNESTELQTLTHPSCPRCQTGQLVVRENTSNKKFLGCSNYPGCGYTLKHIEVLNNQIKCTSCGGYMVKRKSRYGKYFYGCSYYPRCGNTLEIG
jgi:DNA helicase IV